MANNAIKVFIKVRPLIARETNENSLSQWSQSGNTLVSTDNQYKMSFDHIYDATKTTSELFDAMAKPIVLAALKGINGTIFAYGQTSSGKTYTMMGDDGEPGIIPQTINEIFSQMRQIPNRKFLVRTSYIEIYNEKMYDLLDDKRPEVTKFNEPTAGEVSINTTEIVTKSAEDIMKEYKKGNKIRRTAETSMNERSSRSHSIFRIIIESTSEASVSESTSEASVSEDLPIQVASLNLVDLAGSERADPSKAVMKEGCNINMSLLFLGNVIRILSDDNTTSTTYIPYRDSKLTRLLSASIGGNAMTSIICTVTPAALEETYSTLLFAANAEKIKNKPQVNEKTDDKSMMRRMQVEINKLKSELEAEKSRNREHQVIQRIMQQIDDREANFLHSHSVLHAVDRRKTWAPPSTLLPPFPAIARLAQPMYVPHITPFCKPTVHVAAPSFDDEEFQPGEECNLDRTLSPGAGPRNTAALSEMILTPREMRKIRYVEDSPIVKKLDSMESLKLRVNYLEDELQELNDFRKLEEALSTDAKKIAAKLEYANEQVTVLELKNEELQRQIAEQNCDERVKIAQTERDKAVQRQTAAENNLASIMYDHEVFRTKVKKREEELAACLDEARSECKEGLQKKIRELEEKLKTNSSATVDSLAGGDMNLNDRIADLQHKLNAQTDLQAKLEELTRNYDEMSTQLMDTIQENEQLNKKIQDLKTRTEVEAQQQQQEINNLSAKFQLFDEIVKSIVNDTEPPITDDDLRDGTISNLSLISSVIRAMRGSDEELENLRRENEALKTKLPTLPESDRENESELKDQIDSLTLELSMVKSEFGSTAATEDERPTSADKETATEDTNESDAEIQELISKLQEESNKVKELEGALSNQESELTSEISELKDGLQRLMSLGEENDRLKSAEKEHKRVSNELTLKLDEIQERDEELKAAKGISIVRQQRIVELERDEVTLKKSLEQLESRLSQQLEKVARHEVDNEMLLDKVETLEGLNMKLPDLSRKNEQLENEIQSLQELLSQSQGDKESTATSSNTSGDFETIVQSVLVEQRSVETGLRQELLEASLRITSLENELTAAKEAEQRHQASVDLQMSKVNASAAELEKFKEESLKNEAESERLMSKLTVLESELQKGKEMLIESEIKVAEYQKQASLARIDAASAEAELNALKHKFEEVYGQLETKERSINILEKYLTDKNREIDELQLEISAKEGKQDMNQKRQMAELDGDKTKLKEAEAEVITLKGQLEMLRVEINSLKDEKSYQEDDHHSQVSQLRAEVTEANDRCNALKSSITKAEAECTNLQSKLLLSEEEEANLQKQLKERTKECDEIKIRLRRRSSENDKKIQYLENEKSELVQQIGAAAAEKATIGSELRKLNESYATMKDSNAKLQSEIDRLKIASDDNDLKYALLDEQFSQLQELKQTLEGEMEVLRRQQKQFMSTMKANERLEQENSQLNGIISTHVSEAFTLNKTIADLREELLKNQRTPTANKPTTPEPSSSRQCNELFVSQNQQVLMDAHRLTPSRALEKNIERKTRRQSVHDQGRRLSAWERFSNAEAQTDAVSEVCACSELAEKVKELKIEVRLKECKIGTMDQMAKHNPLKLDVDDLKKALAREKREHHQTKSSLEKMSRNAHKFQNEAEAMAKSQTVPKETTSKSTQASDQATVRKTDYDSVIEQLAEQKRVCGQRQLKIIELEAAGANENVNRTNLDRTSEMRAMENDNKALKAKLQEMKEKASTTRSDEATASCIPDLAEEFTKLQKKYDLTRRLCNLRNDDISKAKQEVSQLEENLQLQCQENLKLLEKYSTVKQVCKMRLDKLNVLRARLGEGQED